MVQFSIDERAVKNFAVFFGSFIKEQIETFYNPDFLIDFDLKTYSFSFYEKQIIICSIEGILVLLEAIHRAGSIVPLIVLL